MKVKLQVRSSHPTSALPGSSVPLVVTIKAANNFPGSFEYRTDSRTFLKLLRQNTDLSDLTLEQFQGDLQVLTKGQLHSVILKDEILEELGYFIN